MHNIGEVANLRVKLLGLRTSSLSQDKEKIRSARKIPPNGKPTLATEMLSANAILPPPPPFFILFATALEVDNWNWSNSS